MNEEQKHPAFRQIPKRQSNKAVRGFRTWNVPKRFAEDQEPFVLLRSINQPYVWASSEVVAHCLQRGDKFCGDAPGFSCSCGLYGWHLPDVVLRAEAVGVVEALGKVLSAQCGWRAKKVRIVALYIRNEETRELISRSYTKPEYYPSLEMLLSDYPGQVDPLKVYGPMGMEVHRFIRAAKHENGAPWHTLSTIAGPVAAVHGRTTPYQTAIEGLTGLEKMAVAGILLADVLEDARYERLVRPYAERHGDPLGRIKGL